MQQDTGETVTVREACTMLSICRATLYTRMKQGRIKPLSRNSVQDSTRLRFDRALVEELAMPKPHTLNRV